MRTLHALASTAAVMVLAAGCGDAADSSTSNPTAPITTLTQSPTTTSAEATSAAATSSEPAVGSEVVMPVVSITLLGVTDNAKIEKIPGDPTGVRWVALSVKTCVRSMPADYPTTATGITLTWAPWSVQGADGALYDANVTRSDFPAPLYPSGYPERQFKPGECVTGNIYVPVNTGVGIQGVRYDNGRDEPSIWSVNEQVT